MGKFRQCDNCVHDGLGHTCCRYCNFIDSVMYDPKHYKPKNNAEDYGRYFIEGYKDGISRVLVDKQMKKKYRESNIHVANNIWMVSVHITKVIFNDPATIVFWSDKTKTVVKADGEVFDPEKGLAMAITKKAYGNQGNYCNELKKWLPETCEEKEK